MMATPNADIDCPSHLVALVPPDDCYRRIMNDKRLTTSMAGLCRERDRHSTASKDSLTLEGIRGTIQQIHKASRSQSPKTPGNLADNFQIFASP
jgi:hypothetical protein